MIYDPKSLLELHDDTKCPWEEEGDDVDNVDAEWRRLARSLLATGMLNEKFLAQILNNEVDFEYVTAAFKNFREAMHTGDIEVETEYVVGFVFDPDESHLLLIWKNRPAWQAGKLNGPGGKRENGETPLAAMEREFGEETGFLGRKLFNGEVTSYESPDWKLVGTRGRAALFPKQPGSYKMYVFAAHFDTFICDASNFEHGQLTQEHYKDSNGNPCGLMYMERPDQGETIIRLPLNLQVIANKGVPGLAGLVDLARASLKENFTLEMHDPVNMDHVE
jgi:8-oxo-dGTP pyrophosphatase MutT (NUDIX family)